ncbi:MAG: SH3 domain-containing protein [Candidatus Caenarcaniphilales bacterium]|nr:SH3 domain-containing protein [Candidatus Caenarcaniphilales bacterium]
MKRFGLVFLFVILLSALSMKGYAEEGGFAYGKFASGAKIYVFGDLANIRKEPSVKAELVGKVKIGEFVTIKEQSTKTHQVNGFEDYWYKVEYKAKEPVVGYIWGGTLAKSSLQGKDELILLGITGLNSPKESDKKQVEVRLVKKGAIISRVSFPAIETPDSKQFSYSVTSQELPDKGFVPATRLLSFAFEYGACDYLNGEVLLSLNEKNLQYVLSAYSSGNELGSSTAEYIFPKDREGRPNQLILRETTSVNEPEVDPKTKEEKYIPKKVEQKDKTYQWEGKEFKLIN